MSKQYNVHGMFQDVIDYMKFIDVQANTPVVFPVKVKASRKPKHSYLNKKFVRKTHRLGKRIS